jgi:hypothetical protein
VIPAMKNVAAISDLTISKKSPISKPIVK